MTQLERTLGVPVVVLRLLTVEGSDGARDGHVTYHAEALEPPGRLPGCDFADDDHPLRLPWARASGVRELLEWASGQVDLTGRPVQRKTWNLSGLFRLPTADGPVWLKAVPGFAAAEPAAIAAIAAVDPDLVPAVLASGPGRLLLADVPGADCWDASPQVAADAVGRLAAAQARVGRPPHGHPRPPPAEPGGRGQRPARRPGRRRAEPRGTATPPGACGRGGRCWPTAACPTPSCTATSIPATGVRATARRSSSTSPTPTWATRCSTGCARSTSCRAGRRRAAADAWIAAWTAAAPGSRPAEALRIAAPLAHLAYAVRYQEFLDNIEPSEHVYHRGDPASSIRQALACAAASAVITLRKLEAFTSEIARRYPSRRCGVLISTMNDIPGYEVTEVLGEVFGLTVRSRNIGSQFGAAFKSMAGGELKGMTKNLIDSRNEVIDRMTQEAQARGGNAVMAMRFDTSEMGQNWTEICAYGTAVKVQKK